MILPRSIGLAWLNLFLVLVVSGCTQIDSSAATQEIDAQTQSTLAAVVTATMSSLITDTPRPPMDTLTPLRTATAIPTLATPSATPLPPTPTATLVCDRAAAGNPLDITISDDTPLNPGQNFTKIWRLLNVGSCTWTRTYAASFFYGAQMDAPDLVPLNWEVAGGETVEIAVDMIAPMTPGTYQGNWKLRNADGRLFGIGPNGDSPFWVRVVVVAVQTQTPTPTLTSTHTPTPSATATALPTPTPVVLASGSLSFTLDSSLDLDNGTLSPVSGADLLYQKEVGAGFHMLLPQNGAVFGVIGGFEPGPAACQAAAMSGAPLALESISAGTYLCYKTSGAHFGWLRFNSLNTVADSVDFGFHTWAVP